MTDSPQLVFCVHGVGVRGADRMDRLVGKLQRGLGDAYRLVPIYWGDVGASGEHLDTLIAQHPERSGTTAEWLADTFGYVAKSTHGQAQVWVKKQRDYEEGKVAHQAWRDERAVLKGRVRGFLHDRFREVRRRLSEWMMPYAADVIVYQSPARRAVIQQRVREVIAEHAGPDAGTAGEPIHMIAHSLGGVMSFDLALDAERPMHYANLVTLGSQPAFFHVMDPRPGLPAFEGEPVKLPATFARWTNVWDDYDLLAFGVRDIFRLHDGGAPTDVHVHCYRNAMVGAAFMQAHLGYWDKPAAHRAIGAALAE